MKYSKRSFAVVSLLFAVLLSLSIRTLNARDADLTSRTLMDDDSVLLDDDLGGEGLRAVFAIAFNYRTHFAAVSVGHVSWF